MYTGKRDLVARFEGALSLSHPTSQASVLWAGSDRTNPHDMMRSLSCRMMRYLDLVSNLPDGARVARGLAFGRDGRAMTGRSM